MRLTFFKNRRKTYIALAAVFLMAGILLIIPKPAHAGIFGDLVSFTFGGVSAIISMLADIVFKILAYLLKWACDLFDYAINPNIQQFTKAPIVQDGWKLSLGIANMFFALALIIMAFATILRIDEYGIKALLPRLIVAALLINFSLVMAGVIIDFTQVLTNYFYTKAAAHGKISTQLVGDLQSQTVFQKPPDWGALTESSPAMVNGKATCPTGSDFVPDGNSAGGEASGTCKPTGQTAASNKEAASDQFLRITIASILGIILISVAIFAIAAAAILLIIRVVYLWILLILAPLAWLLSILPPTRGQYNKWWSSFFNQAFFAPVFMFFIYLALNTANTGAFRNASIATQNGSFNPQFIFNYIVIIAFLVFGLMLAKSMGAAGASTVIGWGKSIRGTAQNSVSRWAAGGARMPIISGAAKVADKLTFGKLKLDQRWTGAKQKMSTGVQKATKGVLGEKLGGAAIKGAKGLAFVRKTAPSFLVPQVWKRALNNMEAKADAKVYPMAAARMEGILSGDLKQVKLLEQRAKDVEVGKKVTELGGIYQGDEERLIDAWQKAKDPTEQNALIRLLAATNGLNTLLKSEGKEYSGDNLRTFIRDKFGNEEGARIAASVGGIGRTNKNYSYVGMTQWDSKEQRYKFVEDDKDMAAPGAKNASQKQARAAASAARTEERQDWARGVRADSFVNRDASGAFQKTLSETGKNILSNITLAQTADIGRMKAESLEALAGAAANIKAHATEVAKTDQAQGDIINKFIDQVEENYKKKKSNPLPEGVSTA